MNFCQPLPRPSGSFASPSLFQESSIRLSSTTSKKVFVLLTTSMSRSGIGNDPSFGTEFSSWLNVMTTDAIPSDRPENHRHPLACLMDDTRPTLPEEHRCALLHVQGDPDFEVDLRKTCSKTT